jgi:hypothetical protein
VPVPAARQSTTTDITTPAPGGSARADRTPPELAKLKLRAITHGARVRFTVSESSRVTIRFRHGKHTVRTFRLAVRAGSRAYNLRSSRIKRGTYTVQVQARDARGNQGKHLRAKVKVKR